MDNVTKIRACLFGGAMGDALGAEIEFWSLERIRARFPGGLKDLPQRDGRAGRITDDTQMTLFTAEGLIRAVVRGQARGICAPEGVVHHALLRWYRTQGGVPKMDLCDRGLIADARLHKRRAPGTTCLSALGEARHFGDVVRNDRKGCGTIMRVAPCALIACNPAQAETLARDTSALTHGHVLGQEAAVAFARILFEVFHGATLERAVGSVSLSRPIMAALEAAMTARPDGAPETVERLGGGWVAEEALAIALYAARVQEIVLPVLRVGKKRKEDVGQVSVQIVPPSRPQITTGQIQITLYQAEPVTEKQQPRQLIAAIFAEDGTMISDEVELLFDFTSENPREREMPRSFLLNRAAEGYNDQMVMLKLRSRIGKTTLYEDHAVLPLALKRGISTELDF